MLCEIWLTIHMPCKMHESVHHVAPSFFFIFLLFNFRSVKSEKQTIQISSDARSFILIEDFGFNNAGYISVSISSVSVTTTTRYFTSPTKSSLMGCFYAPTPALESIKLALLKDICIVGKPFVLPILSFNEKTILSKPNFNKTVHVTIPDLYYIFFVNCANNTSISLTLNLETYNVNPSGDRDYMDENLNNLRAILFVFGILYSVFFLAWCYACNENKPFLHKIHAPMAALLSLRVLELASHAATQLSISLTGSPHGWNVVWHAIYFFRSILFIHVTLLLGAGWSLFRPNLTEIGKCIMTTASILQVIACSSFILIREAGPSDKKYSYCIVAYFTSDFLCCVMMMIPVRKTLDNLDDNSKIEVKEARRLVHKRVYENFAIALYVYAGLTRLGLFMVRAVTSYKLWSLTIASELGIELMFYIVVYVMFWPNERYDYVVLEDREEPISAVLPISRTGF